VTDALAVVGQKGNDIEQGHSRVGTRVRPTMPDAPANNGILVDVILAAQWQVAQLLGSEHLSLSCSGKSQQFARA
jgi:hypothetical protein